MKGEVAQSPKRGCGEPFNPAWGEVSYAEVMTSAKANVNLEELEISHVSFKKTRTGGLLLGESGPDSGRKADRLAARLRSFSNRSRAHSNRALVHVLKPLLKRKLFESHCIV